ncbi:MAG: hypothetical protein ACKVVP_03120 [Chloroflexota bacterium]
MAMVLVVNVYWVIRQIKSLGADIWAALPYEVTSTAAAHPSRAVIGLGVLILVFARVATAGRGTVALAVTRVLLLLEMEALLVALSSVNFLGSDGRRNAL